MIHVFYAYKFKKITSYPQDNGVAGCKEAEGRERIQGGRHEHVTWARRDEKRTTPQGKTWLKTAW